MRKLIVEMEINGIPDCCGLCDPLFMVVCATKHDQTIDKMMLRAGRPSWCPIKGEIVPCSECVHSALASAGCCMYDRNVCVSGKRKE